MLNSLTWAVFVFVYVGFAFWDKNADVSIKDRMFLVRNCDIPINDASKPSLCNE